MLNFIPTQQVDIAAYISDMDKFRTAKELVKINMSRASHPKLITKEHLIMLEDVANELLKNDRFQIQGTTGGYILVKKNENIDGFDINNALGINTILAKTSKLSVENINNINEVEKVLLDTFQEFLKDSYISMFVMFNPREELKNAFIVRFGKLTLREKEEYVKY